MIDKKATHKRSLFSLNLSLATRIEQPQVFFVFMWRLRW